MAQPNLWGGVLDSLQSPLTLGGLSLLAGEGLQPGIAAGTALTKQAQAQRSQEAVRQGLLGMPNLNDSDRQVLGNSPELANEVLSNIYKQRFDPMAGVDLAYKKALTEKAQREAAGGGETPSNIREWQAFQRMTPEQQRAYLTMKRADRFYNLGTSYAAPDPLNPAGPPVASLPIDNAGKAGDVAAGKVQGAAAANLPMAERNAAKITSDIQSVLDDPYLPNMTGPISGRLPNISAASNRVQSKLDKIQGETFIQAFDSLRGGGQITEAEGAKATASLNRLQNTKQGTQDYIDALREFKQDVADLLQVARQKAARGGVGAAPVAPIGPPAAAPASPPPAAGGWSIKRLD